MAVWAHATTIGLSSISLLFTVVMMFGTRGQVGWSVGEEDLNNDEVFVRFGLIGFETNSKGNEGVFGIYNYDSEGCKDIFAGGQVDSDTCDDCAGAGGAAFTFTFFGMVFLVVLLGAQYLRHKHMIEFMFPALNLLNFLIAFCFFLVWTIWIGGCHQYLRDDEIFKEFDVTPGAGWALGFMIFIFSIVGGVFELVFAETLSPPIKTMPRVSIPDVDTKKDEEKVEVAHDAQPGVPSAPSAPVAVAVEVVSDQPGQNDNNNNNNNNNNNTSSPD